jgi:hypothetical protein
MKQERHARIVEIHIDDPANNNDVVTGIVFGSLCTVNGSNRPFDDG